MENGSITLTCSTLSSCGSDLRIGGLTQLTSPQSEGDGRKSTSVSFPVSWQDDGKEFSCHIHDDKDEYLIRNITVTVECKFIKFIYVMSTIPVVIFTTDMNKLTLIQMQSNGCT